MPFFFNRRPSPPFFLFLPVPMSDCHILRQILSPGSSMKPAPEASRRGFGREKHNSKTKILPSPHLALPWPPCSAWRHQASASASACRRAWCASWRPWRNGFILKQRVSLALVSLQPETFEERREARGKMRVSKGKLKKKKKKKGKKKNFLAHYRRPLFLDCLSRLSVLFVSFSFLFRAFKPSKDGDAGSPDGIR